MRGDFLNNRGKCARSGSGRQCSGERVAALPSSMLELNEHFKVRVLTNYRPGSIGCPIERSEPNRALLATLHGIHNIFSDFGNPVYLLLCGTELAGFWYLVNYDESASARRAGPITFLRTEVNLVLRHVTVQTACSKLFTLSQ